MIPGITPQRIAKAGFYLLTASTALLGLATAAKALGEACMQASGQSPPRRGTVVDVPPDAGPTAPTPPHPDPDNNGAGRSKRHTPAAT